MTEMTADELTASPEERRLGSCDAACQCTRVQTAISCVDESCCNLTEIDFAAGCESEIGGPCEIKMYAAMEMMVASARSIGNCDVTEDRLRTSFR